MKVGSIDVSIPLGGLAYGSDDNVLTFKSETLANLGAANLKFEGRTGTGGSTVNSTGGTITSVVTGNSVATILPSPTAEDSNRFEILFTYLSDPRPSPPDPVYRKIVMEMVDNTMRITESTPDKTVVRAFSKPAANQWLLDDSGMRRTYKTTVSETAVSKITRNRIDEKGSDNQWKTISSDEIQEKRFSWGWETVRTIADPDGAALVTDQDYYDRDPAPGAVNVLASMGRIKSELLPTGLSRTYQYLDSDPYLSGFTQVEVIQENYAGTANARETRIHKGSSGGVYTTLEETWVSGSLVSKKEIVASATSRIEKVYPSAGAAPLVTQTVYNNGSQETTYSDGTIRKVVNATANNLLTETTYEGVKNPNSGHFLVRGTESVKVLDSAGNEQRTASYRIHNGVSYRVEERVTAVQDHLGRPQRIDVFEGNASAASYSETSVYSCCGLAEETGRDGITSYHYYDALGRRWKTHRNGISEETVRDGLVTHHYRFAQALPTSVAGATYANELANETLDLTGEETSHQDRSPKDGSLITTFTQMFYQPAAGIGKRIIRTSPQTADDQGVSPTVTEDYYPDGLLKSRYGPLVVAEQFDYSANATGLTETTSKIAAGGTTFGAETIQRNWAGQSVSTTYAGDKDGNGNPDLSQTIYDGAGRLQNMIDPDGVITMFSHDPATGIEISALDRNGNGLIDLAVDQIDIHREGTGLNASGKVILWSEEAARSTNAQGTNTEVTLSRKESGVDGLGEISFVYGGGQTAISATATQFIGAGSWNTTTTRADGTSTTDRYRGGLLTEKEQFAVGGVSLVHLGLSYDANHRPDQIIDSRGPSTVYQYVSPLVDLVSQTTVGNRISSVTYDERGRTTSSDEPDSVDSGGNPVSNTRVIHYWPHGGVREETGTPGYRASYTYDAAHRMETLTTYGTATAITRWEYDADRGWLLAKRQNSPAPGQGSGESYTYTVAGRLHVRTLARNITSTYQYDSGSLKRIDYSDNTPADHSDDTPAVVIQERDQQGRVRHLADAAGERTLNFDAWGGLADENYSSGGVLAGWSVTRSRDAIGRLAWLTAGQTATGTSVHSTGYGYNSSGRVETVASGGKTASYRYDPLHQRVAQIGIASGTAPVLYGTLQYDALRRLERISYHDGQTGGALQVFSDYHYQRDGYGNIGGVTAKDRTKQVYGYNSAGEVATAKRLLTAQGSTYLRGQSFGWTYDGIGNRLTSARGGDDSADNLRGTTYTPDAINQYALIQNPAAADVIGLAPAADNVTVNGSPASRQGEFFHHEVTGANSTGPDWKAVSVIDGSDMKTGSLLIPPASQVPVHDADGNLTSDGIYGFTWDGENRLVKTETLASAVLAGVPYQRVECVYDSQWRRVRRLRFDQPSSTTPVETTRYLWAGWRCLAEIGATDALKKSLVWGLDQQQTLHLGDGNGAVLWTNDHATGESHFCHYDGNGNIVGLSNAAGEPTAEYQYSAFGELIGKRGRYADANLYRFSTKPLEEVGGIYYYGYRYLVSLTGGWLSSDPIGENGGINLYGFVINNPVEYFDLLGLDLKLEGTAAADGFHRRASVTDPSSSDGFHGQSFGLNRRSDPQQGASEALGEGAGPGKSGGGSVYKDQAPATNTVDTFKTTPEEDEAIKKAMEKELGNTGPYNQWTNSCRDYSKDLYNRMKKMIIEARPAPPKPPFPIIPTGY